MSEREQLLWAQARSMRLVFLLNVAGLVPFFATAVFSGSMVLWTDALDYARAVVLTFAGWRILCGVAAGRFCGFDYGTEKLQSLFAMGGAFVYLGVLFVMGANCIHRLAHPVPLEGGFSLAGTALLLVSGTVDGIMCVRNRRLSRRLFSAVLETQWRVERTSALVSISSAAGLFLAFLFRDQAWGALIDPACALVLIAYGAVSFLPSILADFETLADKSLKEELQLRIDRRLAENFRGYSGFHGVRSRRSGGSLFIEIALSFPGDMTVADAVRTVEGLRSGVQNDIPGSEVSVVLHGAAGKLSK